ncbi:hypothetical protein [Maricaulis sp. MIT060901]|uniref:hypothetical protein n=1 Tax=Maricaulis sp. MIT060901 TaxID=3096993 RepID=UPI00399A37C4
MSLHDRNQYILALAALLFSAIAMVIAFFELRSSDKQLEANVWPYVDMNLNLEADTFSLQLENKGMGPALIHEFRVRLAGEEVVNAVDLVEAAGYALANLSMSTETVPDSVLAVGEELVALQIDAEGIGLNLRELISSMEVEICYCSLNNQCWDNRVSQSFRRSVEQCDFQPIDVEGALQYFEDTNDDAAPGAVDNSTETEADQ